MSVNRYLMPVTLIVVLLGTVFGSQIVGVWSVSGRTSVNLEQMAPEEIKGWMTLQQVAAGLGISLEEVYRVGGIPSDIAPEAALKDLEEIVEVSTLRDALAASLAGSADAETSAPAPEPDVTAEATEIPAATAVPGPAETTSDTSAAPPHTGDGTGPTPLPPGEILPASSIKGRMTLREVSDQCAVDLAALLAALNLPAGTDPDTQLKTLTQSGALDEITQVQAAVAALQG